MRLFITLLDKMIEELLVTTNPLVRNHNMLNILLEKLHMINQGLYVIFMTILLLIAHIVYLERFIKIKLRELQINFQGPNYEVGDLSLIL